MRVRVRVCACVVSRRTSPVRMASENARRCRMAVLRNKGGVDHFDFEAEGQRGPDDSCGRTCGRTCGRRIGDCLNLRELRIQTLPKDIPV